jgi:hypothetical protein
MAGPEKNRYYEQETQHHVEAAFKMRPMPRTGPKAKGEKLAASPQRKRAAEPPGVD